MLPPPTGIASGPTSSSSRDRQQSFADALKEKSAEFEAERLKSTVPPPMNETENDADDDEQPSPKIKEPAGSLALSKTDTSNKKQSDAGKDGKAAGKTKTGKMKPMYPYDPYVAMYDPYAYMAMCKGKAKPKGESWADMEDEEDDSWYSFTGLSGFFVSVKVLIRGRAGGAFLSGLCVALGRAWFFGCWLVV